MQNNSLFNHLTNEEVKKVAPRIMQYVKEGVPAQIAREGSRLDAASPLNDKKPEFIIVTGPISSDKTSFIQKKFSSGYVWLDVFRIYSELKNECGFKNGRVNPAAEFAGLVTLDLAIMEKRSIVIEIVGADTDRLKWMAAKIIERGYDVKVVKINVEAKSCLINEDLVEPDLPINTSSPYTEEILVSWLKKVVN